jgi:hypothetical protein
MSSLAKTVHVMPALVAGIHAFLSVTLSKSWMPGTRLHKAGHDTERRLVMAGLVPAIHVFIPLKSWMPGTRLHKAGHDC